MVRPQSDEISAVLSAWRSGTGGALVELIPLVYDELRHIARIQLTRERRRDPALQPAALVHEAYLRLAGHCDVRWQDQAHFYAVAATTMRRILVEHARHRGAAKRGAGRSELPLAAAVGTTAERTPELVALDDCLAALARINPIQAAIVELRFFGGFSLAETATAVGCSRATVIRQWCLARAWLHRELSATAPSS